MPKYEICIVSKEYRYIEVEANNESDAKDMAWEQVACGYTANTKPEDYDTEVFIDSLIEENTNA